MIRSRLHKKLWEFYITYVADNHSLMDTPIYNMDGRNKYLILTGDKPDILESIEHDCYAPVW